MFRLVRTLSVIGAALYPWPSIAGSVDTPGCHVDLAEADRLVHGIRPRENSVPRGTGRGNTDFYGGICAI
jgi:hypothetical protein